MVASNLEAEAERFQREGFLVVRQLASAQECAALRSLARSPGIRLLDCATDAEPRTLLAQQFRPR